MVDQKKMGLTKKDIFLKGTVIAVLVTIPSLIGFFTSWYIIGDLIVSAIIGAVIHFIAMGFSFKISKKFFVKKQPTT